MNPVWIIYFHNSETDLIAAVVLKHFFHDMFDYVPGAKLYKTNFITVPLLANSAFASDEYGAVIARSVATKQSRRP